MLFAKETPTKINFAGYGLKIYERRIRLINPSFSVKVKIVLDTKHVKVISSVGQILL